MDVLISFSCIYHTTNILLHRPILCSKKFRSTEDPTTNANHLVQCLSSATSIIALYDLFRRTFGDSHVVLSLAYSLYTASSIFLLEIQALKYASASTLEKLRYCIIALERVKTTNPGMQNTPPIHIKQFAIVLTNPLFLYDSY